MIWLIKGEGHNILFDAGFYREQFMKQWQPADYQRPDAAIAVAGLKPEDITDVIISHIHWDHADGFDLFPKAKVWIQKEELEYYAGEAWQGHARTAADPDVLLSLVKWNTQGRVNLVNGDAQEIFPGITAYIGGKHTYAIAIHHGQHRSRHSGAGQRQRLHVRKPGKASCPSRRHWMTHPICGLRTV